jgi:hypothetical protein
MSTMASPDVTREEILHHLITIGEDPAVHTVDELFRLVSGRLLVGEDRASALGAAIQSARADIAQDAVPHWAAEAFDAVRAKYDKQRCKKLGVPDWKEALRLLWYRAQDDQEPNGGRLRSIRNHPEGLGYRWLDAYPLKAPKGALKQSVVEVEGAVGGAERASGAEASNFNVPESGKRPQVRSIALSVTVKTESAASVEEVASTIRRLIDIGIVDAHSTLEDKEGDLSAARLATDLDVGPVIPAENPLGRLNSVGDRPRSVELASQLKELLAECEADPQLMQLCRPDLTRIAEIVAQQEKSSASHDTPSP